MRHSEERWDGNGLVYGLRGEATPLPGRVLHLAQSFDALQTFGGKDVAVAAVRERSGGDFDPALVNLLMDDARDNDFWAFLARESVADEVLAMCPFLASGDVSTEEQVDIVCEAAADLPDMVSGSTWNHGATVAGIAADIGMAMNLPGAEVAALRRLGFLHDIGKVTVPSSITQKVARREPLTGGEAERYRLHPYYTEQVLARVHLSRDRASETAAHHEQPDGQGSPKRLPAPQIPLAGRILAVADAYATAYARAEEHREEAAMDHLRWVVGTYLDKDCFVALCTVLEGGVARPMRGRRKRYSLGLSDRETEVLRLVAEGLTIRQIAGSLVISEKTVEHHIKHIFDKLGVTSRTSAVMYGVQQGLVG